MGMSRLARRPARTRPVIEFYASGLLHTEKDFQGVTIVGGKPGIIAAAKVGGRVKYEEKVPHWVSAHLRTGGELFCDSGAFTVAFTGQVLDFNRVFRFYLQLLKLAKAPSQLILVMPDSVGEQSRTLGLWQQYQKGIEWWLRRSCACLFPMQGFEYTKNAPGQISIEEMYRFACQGFKPSGVAAALPMKKAATTPERALAFVSRVQPPHLHLLGLGRKEASVNLAAKMVRASPRTVVTADAVETTTAYGGRHGYTPAAFKARVDAREAVKGGKRRDIWYRDRVTKSREEELDWWFPLDMTNRRDRERFEDVVQELVADAGRSISRRQAERALTDPVFARHLFRAYFRAVDPIIAMADHMVARMHQVPVPDVGEVL
jgi:hypothetical protein